VHRQRPAAGEKIAAAASWRATMAEAARPRSATTLVSASATMQVLAMTDTVRVLITGSPATGSIKGVTQRPPMRRRVPPNALVATAPSTTDASGRRTR